MNEILRHNQIVEWVNNKSTLTVANIIDAFHISPATARRDIVKLAEAGRVIKVRNGIMRVEEQKPIWRPLECNETENYHEKARIALRASKLCQDGESVVLNCGSTAFLLGRELCGRALSIITNYFPLASYLIEHDHDNVIIIGGQYNKSQNIILNPISDLANAYTGKWMFTSGKALTAAGLYKTEILTAVSEQQMLDKVEKIVAVVDSSKVGRVSSAGMLFCPITKIDIVITGKMANKEVIDSIRQQGVEVILV